MTWEHVLGSICLIVVLVIYVGVFAGMSMPCQYDPDPLFDEYAELATEGLTNLDYPTWLKQRAEEGKIAGHADG